MENTQIYCWQNSCCPTSSVTTLLNHVQAFVTQAHMDRCHSRHSCAEIYECIDLHYVFSLMWLDRDRMFAIFAVLMHDPPSLGTHLHTWAKWIDLIHLIKLHSYNVLSTLHVGHYC